MASLMSRLRIFTLVSLTGLLTACFIDDDNNAVETPAAEDPPAETTENTVSGSVVKGPVNGALVIVYEFDGTTEIGRGETGVDGTFSISIGDNAGGVVISASGGTYTDEATGAENVQFGAVEMRAAYMIPESMTPPFDATINVTPFTELAVREALVNGEIDAQILAEVNADFFDLGDDAFSILSTLPTDALADSVSEGTAEDLYGLYLAMFSQIVSDESLGSWDEAVELLETLEDDESILSAALTALAESDSAAGANITLEAAQSALDSLGVSITIGGDNGGSDGGSNGGDGGSGGGSETFNITVGLVDNVGLTSYDVGLRLVDAGNNNAELGADRLLTGNSSLTFTDIPDNTSYAVEIQFGGSFNDVTCTLSNETGTLSGLDVDNVVLTCDSSSGGSSSSSTPCNFGEPSVTTVPAGLAGTVGDLTLTFVPAGSDMVEGTVTNFTFSSSGFLFVDNVLVAETPYLCGGNTFEINWYDEANDLLYAPSFKQDGTFNELNVASASNGIMFLGQYTDENGDFANVTNASADSGGNSSGGGADGGSSATGNFTLTITGTVTATVGAAGVAVDIPTITISNIAAPDPNDDFTVLLEESDFNVTGEVTVTVINNSADRVTFNLQFEGSNQGVDSTYDLTYDYQK